MARSTTPAACSARPSQRRSDAEGLRAPEGPPGPSSSPSPCVLGLGRLVRCPVAGRRWMAVTGPSSGMDAWCHRGARGMRRTAQPGRCPHAADTGLRSVYCAVDRIASRTLTCSGVKFARR